MSTAMIIDGQNLLMRAIFAARGSNMSSGSTLTGPLLIFINSLAKHVQQERPERLVVCWDGGTSEWRRTLLPSYKAHRKPVPDDEQQDRDETSSLVRRFLGLCAVHQNMIRGNEADDLIAGAWRCMATDVDRIVILSSDKDFLQLVGPSPHGIETELVRLSSAGTPTDRWTWDRVCNEMGYAPENWPLVTALAGDASDGVPGLPGIGPKRAVKLLEAAGWDLAKLDRPEGDLLLARNCYDVVSLRGVDLPVFTPLWRPTTPSSILWGDLIEFLAAYELRTVKDRLQMGELWALPATQSDIPVSGRA